MSQSLCRVLFVASASASHITYGEAITVAVGIAHAQSAFRSRPSLQLGLARPSLPVLSAAAPSGVAAACELHRPSAVEKSGQPEQQLSGQGISIRILNESVPVHKKPCNPSTLIREIKGG